MVKETHFSSKADVLRFLMNKLQNSKIEDFIDFVIKDWKNDSEEIISNIQTKFNSDLLIVRSSAKDEDSEESSSAGKYESVPNVNASNISNIISAINSVILSYAKSENFDDENKIIVQKQTEDAKISGVIFSRTEDIGAPYYTINFDKSSSTDGVTSGRINNVLKIFRNIESNKIPDNFKLLINAVKEIEGIYLNDMLDIEFAITKKLEVVIFQVRPLTSIKNSNLPKIENIKEKIEDSKEKFLILSKNKDHFGNQVLYSDMTDWNPAEIIGNNPNMLDYSLYDYLIMDNAWAKGRSDIGYHQMDNTKLMINFGNKPYVDVRASFNSLLPNNIENALKEKMVNFFLEKLKKNPELHDKVEFEILLTCYDLNLPKKIQELENNFTKNEITNIERSLIDFTNNIFKEFPSIYQKSLDNLLIMNQRRKNVFVKLQNGKRNYDDCLAAAHSLLKDCLENGTRIFSTMARIAFIANTILKSAKTQEKIKQEDIELFMNSIRTPLSELREDFNKFCNSNITKKEFFEKYGHLRPGTYDIMSIRYDKDNPYFDNIRYLKSITKSRKFVPNFDEIFRDTPLNITNQEFFDFVEKATVQREKLKFEFTKNLSDAIELIAEAGKNLGFNRKEMANLDIRTILKSIKEEREGVIKDWKTKIEKQANNKKIGNWLILPPFIKDQNDFELISYLSAKPNFVTLKSLSKDLIDVNNAKERILENKIVLIENADPGFDWIFTKNPAGLITKYGGVASHMSIRCSEIGLPAAIGCGEILFEKLLKSSKVMLDCENEQIIILENELTDEEIEIKKTLKSIGYIK